MNIENEMKSNNWQFDKQDTNIQFNLFYFINLCYFNLTFQNKINYLIFFKKKQQNTRYLKFKYKEKNNSNNLTQPKNQRRKRKSNNQLFSQKKNGWNRISGIELEGKKKRRNTQYEYFKSKSKVDFFFVILFFSFIIILILVSISNIIFKKIDTQV